LSVLREDRQAAAADAQHFFELCLAATPSIGVMSHQQIWKGRAWAYRGANADARAAAAWTVHEMAGVEAYVSKELAAVVKLPASAAVNLAFFPVQPSVAVAYGDSLLQAVWLLHGNRDRFEAKSLSGAIARRLGGHPSARLRVPGTRHWSEGPRAELILARELPYEAHELRTALAHATR
jgi:hypothetical protein